LLIELDGDSHYQEDSQEYDAVRDQFMHSLGIVVLRFRNDEVMQELNAVIGKIVDVIEDLSPLPSPPLGKGRG
jgi:very-short-patch-repair endonuclease